MSIPVIIINRDRLSVLERLVGQLLLLGYDDLYVLDMDSSYPDLIDYYSTCNDFTLISHQNTGHKALWQDGILKDRFRQSPWVAVTDSDILLNTLTPKGFIEDMICVAKDFRMEKVGLAIEYRDITNKYLKNIIDPIESKYWVNKLPHSRHTVYLSPVDTTMCVVQPLRPFTYSALRLADYPCIHTDWYLDWNNLTDEQLYYYDHADEVVATGKGHWLNWKKQHEQ